jgi:RNA recognition motif-containing protein
MGIYVGNLPSHITEQNIAAIFEPYGSVKCIQIPSNQGTEYPTEFALVDMVAQGEEATAIHALDGLRWIGHYLIFKEARPHINGQSTSSTTQQPQRDRWSSI